LNWATTTFQLGDGLGLVGRDTMALILTDDEAIRSGLLELVAAEAPLDELLEGLSSRGIRSLPSFAIARLEDDGVVRVVVRGTGSLVLEVSGVDRLVVSGTTSTWLEELVYGVSTVTLRLGANDEEAAPPVTYHVLAGAVPAVTLSRTLANVDRHASAAAGGWRIGPAVAAGPVPVVSTTPAIPNPAPSSFPEPYATLMPGDLEDLHADEVAAGIAAVGELVGELVGEPAADDYDFIFGRTIARSVQTAAVAAPEESELAGDAEQSVGAGGGVPPVPSPSPALAPPAVPAPMLVPESMPQPTGLIEGIPGVGARVPGTAAAPPIDQLGDHDGRTISKAQLAMMRGSSQEPKPVGSGPLLQAVLCPSSHPNPPHAAVCRVCSMSLLGAMQVSIVRPPLGLLRFSNGRVEILDRSQLIGRSPRVEGTVGEEIPNLIKLDEGGQGLSRRHAAIRLEGWQVLLEDLNSANGTIVSLPGRPARRLHAGEPVILEPGSLVDLGGEISFSFEVPR
jgi:hypothetical protein